MASGGDAARSGSMIGSLGTPPRVNCMPLTRIARCSTSVRPSPS
jgi:hypothetical protein